MATTSFCNWCREAINVAREPMEVLAIGHVMQAGLRGGELQALRAEDVDVANGMIRVEYGWDWKTGEIPLKFKAGRRKVRISAVLRDYLADRLAATGRTGSERIFGSTGSSVFEPNRPSASVRKRRRGPLNPPS